MLSHISPISQINLEKNMKFLFFPFRKELHNQMTQSFDSNYISNAWMANNMQYNCFTITFGHLLKWVHVIRIMLLYL